MEKVILFQIVAQQCGYGAKFDTKCEKELRRTIIDLSLVKLVWFCSTQILSVAFVDARIPPGWIMWPKQSIWTSEKNYFFAFSDAPAHDSTRDTVRKLSRCPSADLKKCTTSFRYMSVNWHFTVDSIMSVARWNMLNALFRLKGILKISKIHVEVELWCCARLSRQFLLTNRQNWLLTSRICVFHLKSPSNCTFAGLSRRSWRLRPFVFCIQMRINANWTPSKQIKLVTPITPLKAL